MEPRAPVACTRAAGAHKCAPPFTEAEFEIRYGTGVDTLSELIDLGLSRGLIEKSGNHLSFAGGAARQRVREVARGARAERRAAEHAKPSSRPGLCAAVAASLLWTAFTFFCAACVAAVAFMLWFGHVILDGLGDFSNSPGTRSTH